jgi:UDP-glucuronate 4-epimerase
MKIMITGCAGFIGYHLCKELLPKHNIIGIDNMNQSYDPDKKKKNLMDVSATADKAGKDFIFYQEDIRHEKNIGQIIKTHQPDAVIHLAAIPYLNPINLDPHHYQSVNVSGTLNLLEACHFYEVPHFIFASDSVVYDDQVDDLDESDKTESPLSHLSFTKQSAEKLATLYQKTTKLQVSLLRIFPLFGERSRPDMLVESLINSVKSENPITLPDGNPEINLTNVIDITQGIGKLISHLQEKQSEELITLNLASGASLKLDNILKLIEDHFQKTSKRIYSSDSSKAFMSQTPNINQAQSLIGYKPQTSLEENILELLKNHK